MLSSNRSFLAGIASLAVLAAGTAGSLADTQIFAVKADQPGVTIEKATLDGKELPIVGHGEGSTLFRIDRPDAAVPCAHRILFVTSKSETIDFAADLCALNWDVTLQIETPDAPVAAAPAAPPSPPAEAAAPAPAEPEATAQPESPPAKETTGTSFSQTLTIATDDAATTITEIFFEGKPATITAKEGNTVKTEITGDEKGIVCQRDLGLALSDGRRIARSVNICLNDWHVVVSLAGEPPAPPATPETALPAAPPATPAAPETALPAPAPAPAAPAPPAAPEPALAWIFSAAANQATLAYGVPETDDTRLMASCVKASGRIKMLLLATASGAKRASAVPIAFTLGPFRKAYPGIATPVSEISGASHPQVEIAADDPLWQAIIRERSMSFAVPTEPPVALSLKGSAGPTRQFLAACSPVPVAAAVPDAPALPPVEIGPRPGGIDVTYFCIDGSTLRVTYDGRLRTAVIVEPGAPPIESRSVAGGGDRYAAGPARLVNRGGEVRFSRFGEPARVCQPG